MDNDDKFCDAVEQVEEAELEDNSENRLKYSFNVKKALEKFNIKIDFMEFKKLNERCVKYMNENQPISTKIKNHFIVLTFRD